MLETKKTLKPIQLDAREIEQLAKKGYIEIKNFLPYGLASHLRRSIIHQNHHRAWCLLTRPYQPSQSIKDRIDKPVIDVNRHKQAKRAHNRGKFAFSFYRSANKHENSHENKRITSQFTDILVKHVCPSLQLSGEITDAFFASFINQQFIGYHTDGSAGKYAFIYQLSKGWRKRYGGQLVLYPKHSRFHRKVIEPRFNSLILLDLSHPMPHHVNCLNTLPYQHRITISGWLK